MRGQAADRGVRRGFGQLIAMLAEAGDTAEDPIPVAIETPRGLLVAALRAAGRAVYAINPMAVARYRERYSPSGKKSDHADAMVLAAILRTDAGMHRQLSADTELARSVAVLARAAQDAAWRRPRLQRAALPAARVLPRHARGRRPPQREPRHPDRPGTAPHRCHPGRRREAHRGPDRRRAAPRGPPARDRAIRGRAPRDPAPPPAPPGPARRAGHGHPGSAAAGNPGRRVRQRRGTRPGLPPSLPAAPRLRRDHQLPRPRRPVRRPRPRRARRRPHPIRRRSRSQGIRRVRSRHQGVRALHGRYPPPVKNNRLAAVGFTWAFASLQPSPGARAHYDRRREAGDGHAAALRNLFNRFIGCLYHCIQTGTLYDETTAFRIPQAAAA